MCDFWIWDDKMAATKRQEVRVVPACVRIKWNKKKRHNHLDQVYSKVSLCCCVGKGSIPVCSGACTAWVGEDCSTQLFVTGAGCFRRNLPGLSPCEIKYIQVFLWMNFTCGVLNAIQPAALQCISQSLMHVVAPAGSCPGYSAGRQHSS